MPNDSLTVPNHFEFGSSHCCRLLVSLVRADVFESVKPIARFAVVGREDGRHAGRTTYRPVGCHRFSTPKASTPQTSRPVSHLAFMVVSSNTTSPPDFLPVRFYESRLIVNQTVSNHHRTVSMSMSVVVASSRALSPIDRSICLSVSRNRPSLHRSIARSIDHPLSSACRRYNTSGCSTISR